MPFPVSEVRRWNWFTSLRRSLNCIIGQTLSVTAFPVNEPQGGILLSLNLLLYDTLGYRPSHRVIDSKNSAGILYKMTWARCSIL